MQSVSTVVEFAFFIFTRAEDRKVAFSGRYWKTRLASVSQAHVIVVQTARTKLQLSTYRIVTVSKAHKELWQKVRTKLQLSTHRKVTVSQPHTSLRG